MKLTAQEAQLVYEALRVVRRAASNYTIELIQNYKSSAAAAAKDAPEFAEINATMEVSDALSNLIAKIEKQIGSAQKQKKHSRSKKNERRT